MAVRSFATNNLVEDHDNYVKFMKIRWNHLSKEDKNTDILFYKKGLVTEAFDIKYSKEHRVDVTVQITKYTRIIKLWHSITMAYNLWCEYSRFYVDKDHSRITYKQFVDIPEDVLKKFKFRFEQIVKNAKCEYKTNGGDHFADPCRLLAMFWTYLDIVKDTKTQRYFPNNATIERAAKVFGYKKGDNPFKMNGTFIKRCVRDKKEEEQPVEEEKDLKYAEYAEDHINMVHPHDYNSLLEKFNKLKNNYRELARENDDLLKNKTEMEAFNIRLRDELKKLRAENEELTTQSSKLRVASDPKNLDTITLLNTILEKMKDSKMEYILLTIDGMTVDIHPAKSFPLKSGYMIRSSEVR